MFVDLSQRHDKARAPSRMQVLAAGARSYQEHESPAQPPTYPELDLVVARVIDCVASAPYVCASELRSRRGVARSASWCQLELVCYGARKLSRL